MRRHLVPFLCCVLGSGVALAQTTSFEGATQAVARVEAHPKLPPPISPVDTFRKLLAMNASERNQAITAWPKPQQAVLRSKIEEYSAMPPERREAQLHLIQIRWYLLPLMKVPAAVRGERLNVIPEADRPLIEERLNQWDRLPAELQKDVLDNEMTIQYFMSLKSSTPAQQQAVLANLPEGTRKSREDQLAKWMALPLERRQKMYEHFNQFFNLPPSEKDKALETLSDEERDKMEKSLKVFERLAPSQRKVCVDAFRKFANMSPVERNEFFHNVERWKEMTLAERETWRNLVTLLPPQRDLPPLPPGASGQPPLPGNGGQTTSQIPRGTNITPPVLPGAVR